MECPNCDSENYHYVSGCQNGEPIEPDEGWCDDCGFQYKQHINDPISAQVARFKVESEA